MPFDPNQVSAESGQSEGSGEIAEIVALAQKIQSLAREIDELEVTLDAKKKARDKIANEVLVDLMNSLDLESFTLASGHVVKKTPFVHGRIKDPNTAFDWLREKQEDGIIKNKIEVTLGTGETSEAQSIMQELNLRGVQATQKESIHPSTLKAFLREALANPELAESLPKDAFGVYEGHTVKLINP